MTHAEECPVCRGRGTIKENYTTTAPLGITCHGCNGRGWIVIPDPEPASPFQPSPGMDNGSVNMGEIRKKFREIEAREGKGPHAREEKLELLAYILDFVYGSEAMKEVIKLFEGEDLKKEV